MKKIKRLEEFISCSMNSDIPILHSSQDNQTDMDSIEEVELLAEILTLFYPWNS
jgi:hypothetical protein